MLKGPYPVLYGLALAYSGITYLLGPDIMGMFTILMVLGLPILAYLAVEWIATPLAAFVAGYYARWSPARAYLLGPPLVALVTFVTPVGTTGNQVLSVPVPWLAGYHASKGEVLTAMPERLAWWFLVFFFAVFLGTAQRWYLGRKPAPAAGPQAAEPASAPSLALAVLPLLMGGAVGVLLWAYLEGIVGRNPEAPTAANFLPVAAAYAARSGELRPQCVQLAPDAATQAKRGLPGVQYAEVPGLASVTLPLKAQQPSRQAALDRTLWSYEALVQAGYFTVLPAVAEREYTLTLEGWAHSENGCFAFTAPEVSEVVGLARAQPEGAYEVVYRVAAGRVAPWVASNEAQAAFGEALKLVPEKEARVRVVKGPRGWIPELLVLAAGRLDERKLQLPLDKLLPPLEGRHFMVEGAAAKTRLHACVPLPSQRGMDAADIDTGSPYSATFLDEPAGAEGADVRSIWKARLERLVKAGVFRAERIDAAANRPAATRFVIEERYQQYAGQFRAGCLSLGPIGAIEYVSVRPAAPDAAGSRIAQYKAVAKVSSDAWARSVDLSALPDAAAFLRYGVPFTGRLELHGTAWKDVTREVFLPGVATAPP